MSDPSKRPTHVVVVNSKHSKMRSVVGAAWQNEWGGFGIILHPGVVLDWRMNEDYFISVNPKEWQGKQEKNGREREERPNKEGEDIPF